MGLLQSAFSVSTTHFGGRRVDSCRKPLGSQNGFVSPFRCETQNIMRRGRRWLVLIALVLVLGGGLAGLWFAPTEEGSMPDRLDLGRLAKNARVEISVNTLTSTNLS